MPILAIETSCDETAAAIVTKDGDQVRVLANVISSQAALHAAWGGVVPQLSAREHLKNISPVLRAVFAESGISPQEIDAIAVTQGPGLAPALAIGTQTAKTLAYLWHKPLIGIHHIEGHIYANFIVSADSTTTQSGVRFPLLALVVSGGHTQLMLMQSHFQYEILGETQDDAAGEAFDKVAKILGLPYPGGPEVAKQAEVYQPKNDARFRLPRPMIDSNNYHFSFSGLKTAVLYATRDIPEETRADDFVPMVCHEFQQAVVDVLVAKTKKAIEEFSPHTFVVAGGVSANVELRKQLHEMIEGNFPDTQFLTPAFVYSLDNAAMIGAAAAFRFDSFSANEKSAELTAWQTLEPDPNLKLQNL